MTPKELSKQLRQGESADLSRRRAVAALSLTAAASMGLIALYQLGLIRHLPEPPLPGFDADKVDAAPEAYELFSMPDAALGLGSYAATLTLAAMGGNDRARDLPWVPLALAAKVGFDTLQAGRLTWNQWAKHKAFCFWCLLASGATVATLPLVLPEARAAYRHITGRSS